jgi:hypothetical protein
MAPLIYIIIIIAIILIKVLQKQDYSGKLNESSED